MANQHHPPRALPVQQLVVLSIARFAEPIAMTSVFPYLPEMIESLDVKPDQVAKWAGFAASVFSLSQAIFAVSWGRASDRYGRKPIILICLTGTATMSVMWGFSSSLAMAVAVRAIQGCFSGNVGIIRTTVAEMVPYKELQPRAFSIMPLVWNIGSIGGPALGGALANPHRRRPGDPLPENPGLLDRYPYCLPNIIAGCLFLLGITTGILFLNESMETKRDQRDRGREIGKRITYYLRRVYDRYKAFSLPLDDPERERLLKPSHRQRYGAVDPEMSRLSEPKKPKEPPPSIKEVLTRQSALNLFCYTLLATHNMAFDGLISIYMHYPRPENTPYPEYQFPLKWSGGFGLDTARIGVMFTLYGVAGMFFQFFVFPPLARSFGVVRLLRLCSVATPLIYFLVPFTALIEDHLTQQIAGFILMISKGFFTTFAFPCSTILLTNSASSLRILGTLNGVAVSFSGIGRAAGPALAGAIFTVGVEHGYVIAPWWTLCGIAIVAAIPVFWIVEGEGFGGDNDEVIDSDHEDEMDDDDDAEGATDQVDDEEPTLTRIKTPNRTTVKASAMATGADLTDAAADNLRSPLTRSNTVSSEAIEEEEERDPGSPATPTPRSRRGSKSTPRRVSRRVSIPIGMTGMSRRYSSNLGHSLGSAAGN